MNKSISPITFIDKLVKKNELGQPFKLMDHQREILRLAFTFDEHGRLPWDTVIYSCVKKSGKTTPDLRQHVLNAVSVETPRVIRLSKQKTSNKIDGCCGAVFCRASCGAIWQAAELNRPADENDSSQSAIRCPSFEWPLVSGRGSTGSAPFRFLRFRHKRTEALRVDE